MSQPLVPCPSCARHVRASETACPFCQAELPEGLEAQARPGVARRMSRAAALALGASLAVAACADEVQTTNDASGATSGDKGSGSGGGGAGGAGGAASTTATSSSEASSSSGIAVLYGPAPPPDGGFGGSPPDDAGTPVEDSGTPVEDGGSSNPNDAGPAPIYGAAPPQQNF